MNMCLIFSAPDLYIYIFVVFFFFSLAKETHSFTNSINCWTWNCDLCVYLLQLGGGAFTLCIRSHASFFTFLYASSCNTQTRKILTENPREQSISIHRYTRSTRTLTHVKEKETTTRRHTRTTTISPRDRHTRTNTCVHATLKNDPFYFLLSTPLIYHFAGCVCASTDQFCTF